MPRADATELAPKKSAHPPACHIRAREGFSSRTETDKSVHFFGEAPERRPWAIKRELAPARFCRALPNGFLRHRIPVVPTQASILSQRVQCCRCLTGCPVREIGSEIA